MPLDTSFHSLLLAWYDNHQRHLPWRAPPGKTSNPYHVWLSEIMLQQTTVATVIPYFQRFIERWPSLETLAKAPLEDVLHAWQGLGYYARGRNLHSCAKEIGKKGNFPRDYAELCRLPGIGPYTAAAISSIAFNQPETVVDGNVRRVLSRIFCLEKSVEPTAGALTPTERPGDYAQALMDLGATICKPKSPLCGMCPLSSVCLAYAQGRISDFPPPKLKLARTKRYGTIYWITNKQGELLLQRRPLRGLLGGMIEFPSSPWRIDVPSPDLSLYAGSFHLLDQPVRHIFTHFDLTLYVATGCLQGKEAELQFWCPLDQLSQHAFPSVMKKVIIKMIPTFERSDKVIESPAYRG